MHVQITAIVSDADGTFALPLNVWIPPHSAGDTDIPMIVRQYISGLQAQDLPVVTDMTTVRVISDELYRFERAWLGSN